MYFSVLSRSSQLFITSLASSGTVRFNPFTLPVDGGKIWTAGHNKMGKYIAQIKYIVVWIEILEFRQKIREQVE